MFALASAFLEFLCAVLESRAPSVSMSTACVCIEQGAMLLFALVASFSLFAIVSLCSFIARVACCFSERQPFQFACAHSTITTLELVCTIVFVSVVLNAGCAGTHWCVLKLFQRAVQLLRHVLTLKGRTIQFSFSVSMCCEEARTIPLASSAARLLVPASSEPY